MDAKQAVSKIKRLSALDANSVDNMDFLDDFSKDEFRRELKRVKIEKDPINQAGMFYEVGSKLKKAGAYFVGRDALAGNPVSPGNALTVEEFLNQDKYKDMRSEFYQSHGAPEIAEEM